MSKTNQFPEFQMDVLKEVGNIGAGNAATALSKLLGKPVEMKVPKVKLLSFEQIAEKVGGPEKVIVAIFLRIVGDAPGNMFFILSRESAAKLLQKTAGMLIAADRQYSDMQISALTEIGNILAGSYLSSLADLTNLRMAPTVPSLAIDMAGAILDYGLIQFGEMGDHALLIDTKIVEGDDEVEGHFFVIPDPESFHKIFAALGVPLE